MKLTAVAILVAFFVVCPLSAEAGSRHHHRARRAVIRRSVYRPVRHIVVRQPYYRYHRYHYRSYYPGRIYHRPARTVVVRVVNWTDRELEELAVMKAAAVRGWEEDDLAATVVERDHRRRTGVLEEAELVLRHDDETFTVVLKFDRYGQFEKLKVKVK